jgi:hypothetical protein
MKITEEYDDERAEVIEVTSANYIGNFTIRVFFSDGTAQLVDFKPFLEQSLHPSIRKYLEENLFRNFQLIDGNLNWNDYDMIFPVDNLYNGVLW